MPLLAPRQMAKLSWMNHSEEFLSADQAQNAETEWRGSSWGRLRRHETSLRGPARWGAQLQGSLLPKDTVMVTNPPLLATGSGPGVDAEQEGHLCPKGGGDR